jgi:hypothetical protein
MKISKLVNYSRNYLVFRLNYLADLHNLTSTNLDKCTNRQLHTKTFRKMLKYDLFLSFSGTRKMLYVAYGRFSLYKVEVFSNKFYKFFLTATFPT